MSALIAPATVVVLASSAAAQTAGTNGAVNYGLGAGGGGGGSSDAAGGLGGSSRAGSFGGGGAGVGCGGGGSSGANITGSSGPTPTPGGNGGDVSANIDIINSGVIRGGRVPDHAPVSIFGNYPGLVFVSGGGGGAGIGGGGGGGTLSAVGGRGGDIAGNVTVSNSGSILGGNASIANNYGGSGGDGIGSGGMGGGGPIVAGPGGRGGVITGSIVIDNAATGIIRGGDGWGYGAGGVGVRGQNVTIVNAGTIAGGFPGAAAIAAGVAGQADAIVFAGGINSLELRAGSTIIGHVVAVAGGSDTLILGGNGDAQFDMATIGDDAQFRNFAHFEKSGSSIWTLTNQAAATIAWNIRGGALTLGAGSSLSTTDRIDLSGAGARFDISQVGDQTIGDLAGVAGSTLVLGAGNLAVGTANDTSFGGTISGSGGLTKQGSGTLTLAGSNSYGGGTTIRAGRLQVSGDANLGDDAGGLTFDGGTLATSASFVTAREAAFGAAGGTIETAGGTALGMSGALSGTGIFVKAGDGALLYDGDGSLFTGTTRVTAGRFIVGSDSTHGSAIFGGSLAVEDGGALGGHGIVGTGAGSLVTIASGGGLSPGNSIGTLTIDGDLVFDAGSVFTVEVDPDSAGSDLIHVTGTATLNGGSVAHVGAEGAYGLHSTYAILTADGGVSGAFDGVTSDFAFLTPTLSYDANRVSLTLDRNNIDFAAMAVTANQQATANAIDSIGFAAGNAVYGAIVLLPVGDASIAGSFDALSGEIHASAKTALIEDSRFLRAAATDRLRATFAAPTPGKNVGLWGSGFGAWGHSGADGNAARLDRENGGFLMGADAAVAENWRIGILGGYSHGSFKAKSRIASGTSDNYHLGLYAGAQWGSLGLRGGLAHTWHDLETARSVAFAGFSDALSGDYRARTVQAFGELGHRIAASSSLSLEPFASLAWVSLHSRDFTEKGGAAALHAGGRTSDTTFSTLGLRAASDIPLGEAGGTIHVSLGWRHAFGDTVPISVQAFSAGEAFAVAGVPIAKNMAAIDAGFDLRLSPATSFGLAYQGQLAGHVGQHGVRAVFCLRF